MSSRLMHLLAVLGIEVLRTAEVGSAQVFSSEVRANDRFLWQTLNYLSHNQGSFQYDITIWNQFSTENLWAHSYFSVKYLIILKFWTGHSITLVCCMQDFEMVAWLANDRNKGNFRNKNSSHVFLMIWTEVYALKSQMKRTNYDFYDTSLDLFQHWIYWNAINYVPRKTGTAFPNKD